MLLFSLHYELQTGNLSNRDFYLMKYFSIAENLNCTVTHTPVNIPNVPFVCGECTRFGSSVLLALCYCTLAETSMQLAIDCYNSSKENGGRAVKCLWRFSFSVSLFVVLHKKNSSSVRMCITFSSCQFVWALVYDSSHLPGISFSFPHQTLLISICSGPAAAQLGVI